MDAKSELTYLEKLTLEMLLEEVLGNIEYDNEFDVYTLKINSYLLDSREVRRLRSIYKKLIRAGD